MGVLDDAIREHLELKRQHGASADEVTKQEQEALGAVQGQPVPSAPAADAPPVEPGSPDLPPPPVEHAVGTEGVAETSAPEPDLDPELESEPRPPAPSGDTPPRGFEEIPESPASNQEDPVLDEDPDEEDVLEETPEFLQETPEHDRLWFEQKPPRDFDFDDE
jgi:hypothetical protein